MVTPRTRDEILRWLTGYAQHELGLPAQAMRPDAAIDEIGVDSLEAVAMVGALERWLGRRLPPTLLASCETLDELIDAARGEKVGLAAGGRRDSSRSPHPFTRAVNPYLGRRLEQLKIDKRFVRGRGCYLYGADGSEYLDFLAQYGALPFGHNPAPIWDALLGVRERDEPGLVQPAPLQAASELAERLLAIAPASLDYVTFTNSGAESVEAALKLCRNATGRPGILATERGFHGKTLGALSASGRASYQRPFGLPLPHFHRVPYGDLAALAAALRARPDFYAAFIVEPIQGEGGINVPPADYLADAQRACRRSGVLFVVDEVQTGLGRTGALLASVDAGLEPDVLTLAKALGGGLVSVGACLCNATLYRETFGLKHSSTFAGNALAARAGIATLDWLEREDRRLIRDVARNGEWLRAALERVGAELPDVVGEVRGRGYMLGVRLCVERERWPENLLGVAAETDGLAQLVASYLLNVERVRVAPTLNCDDVIRLEPPLIATRAECQRAVDALRRTLEALSTGDTARFYGSILDRAPRGGRPLRHGRLARPATRRDDARFAFLAHPLDADSYRDFDRSLAGLSRVELEEFADSMDGTVDPFVGSEVRVVSKCGAAASGSFILIPRTARELLRLPHADALDEVREGLALARARGAEIVGLGAYVSVATNAGLALADSGLPLTSGNAFTAVTGAEAIEMALRRLGWSARRRAVAVVGAGGSIGRAMVALLAEHADRLILVGNPRRTTAHVRRQLLDVAAAACRHLAARTSEGEWSDAGAIARAVQGRNPPPPGTPADACLALAEELEQRGCFVLTSAYEALPHAQVVVAATSSPEGEIQAQHLRRGAIICDLSRPRSVTRSVAEERPDVLVIDGGLVEVPGGGYVGPYGIEPGLAYACMAETMLLALERRFENTAHGPEIPIAALREQRRLAEKHGFAVGAIQSFGRRLSDADWNRIHDNGEREEVMP